MKTKQIITILAVLVGGILIGKFALGNASSTTNSNQVKSDTEVQHWTCSMHPEIDVPEFGACPKCGMDLIPKTEDSNGLSPNEFKMTKNAMALANVTTIIVGDKDGNEKNNSNSLSLSGKIIENDNGTSMQTAHFGGRIERLKYKTVGEYVSKGSLIATVYSPKLVTAQNEFIEALEIRKQQPELYKAVRNKLKNWKISEKQILQIERTKKVITNFNMYANVSGYITNILVNEGSHVNEGSPMFKVTNLTNVWAVFDVYEQNIKHLKKGQKLAIKLNAYPDKKINAIIDFIDPNLNTNTRTVAVRATLNNKNKLLKPGMFVTSTIFLPNNKTNQSKITVPKTAVLWTGKRSVVYVKVNPNEPIFEMRKVELGESFAESYHILSGLKNGEEIVVNGIFTVDASAQLQGKKSMMTQQVKNEKLKDKYDNDIKSKENKTERIIVNPKFIKQLNVVFQNYIAVKDALVLTNSKQVNESALQVLKSLEKVKMNLLKKEKAHQTWMMSTKTIKNSLEYLLKQTDIEKQRKEFVNLSDVMITLAQSFGVNKQMYIQHCPMANNNKGANWLSYDKAIKNPYYGDKMLECGSVTDAVEYVK